MINNSILNQIRVAVKISISGDSRTITNICIKKAEPQSFICLFLLGHKVGDNLPIRLY